MSKYFGIDLGTTYSCIATVDADGKPVVLANSEGELITPSVISLSDDGTYCIGAVAKEDITSDGILVEEIKRKMSDISYSIEAGGVTYNPVELSALILKKLKDDVIATGEEIAGVTITCPAYFGQIERKNTEDAGIAAGLNVLSVINEPTAAAYSYVDGMKEGEKKVILVYDLGGGTFDVTLLEVEVVSGKGGPTKKISVITTDGNATLGGKDWDRRLMDKIIEKASIELGCSLEDITEDIESYKEIVRKSEDTKKKLSSKESVKVMVQSPNGRCSVEITKDEFNECTLDLVNTTITLTNNVLEKLVETGKKLDQILLVGGSTRMPMIDEALRRNSKFALVMPEMKILVHDPDQAVAKGAALWANIMGSEALGTGGKKGKGVDSGSVTRPGATIVNEKFSKSYGIVILDNDLVTEKISNLFLKDTSYDPRYGLRSKKQYQTVVDSQAAIDFRIMENLSYDAETALEEGSEIYNFTFQLPEGAPKGTDVIVEFFFDPSSILHISVTEKYKKTSNGENQIKLEGVLSQDEVDEAKDKINLLGRND